MVEAKAWPGDEEADLKKLQELTDELARYQYFVGVFTRFSNDPARVRETGEIVIRLSWFATGRAIPEEETLIRRVGDELARAIRFRRTL